MQVNQIQIKTKDDREVFSLHERDGVSWLSSSSFDQLPGIHMAIATRFGGVSEGMYSTLNFSVSQGDDPAKVRENFIRFGRAIGLPAEQMVLSQQTHTTNLRYCSVEDGGKGILRERGYTDIDGLYTDHNGVGLVISFADCVPVFLADPVKRVVAAVHSGWRGTVGRIGMKMVRIMSDRFGCDPQNIHALIGPSICQDCYEVDEPVITRFKNSNFLSTPTDRKDCIIIYTIPDRFIRTVDLQPSHAVFISNLLGSDFRNLDRIPVCSFAVNLRDSLVRD